MYTVFMTSTSYPRNASDWRGRFIADLVTALSKDIDARIHLWAPPGTSPPTVRRATRAADDAWLERLMAAGGIAASLRRKNVASIRTAAMLLLFLTKAYRRHRFADVIHAHWLQNALPLWGGRQPLVVSVLGSDYGLLRIPGMTRLLRTVMTSRACLIAPNADWMVPGLETAFGDLAAIRPIPFGVGREWFKIERRAETLQADRWIVVSRMTPEKLGPLFDWIEPLLAKNTELHLFGPARQDFSPPPWATFHGPVTPHDLKKTWYPSTRALLTLSEHDEGRPQVILEAMAAGVPVTASDTHAHRDVIAHAKTGWLVRDRGDMSWAMTALNDPDTNLDTGQNARKWVKQHIGTWDDCAARYRQAYRDVMTGEI